MEKNCQSCKANFTIEQDDINFYGKLNVPTPLWCPKCRSIRRLVFINHRSLYKRNCESCNKSIISMYHEDTKIPTWCVACHLGDKWDGRDYGQDYDFSRNFFEQLLELKKKVPHRSLDQNERNGGGCDYSNYCFTSKDTYLSFSVAGTEHTMYSAHIFKGNKYCIDSLDIKSSDHVYESVQSRLSYGSSFLVESDQCIDSHFLFDCVNCNNCCLSSNLRNKSYVFKNKQLSKEEYQAEVDKLKLDTYSGQLKAKEMFRDIATKALHRHAHITNSVNAVGDFIENSKNVYHSYGLISAENVKHVYYAMNTIKDSQDIMFSGMAEECYEFTYGGRGANKTLFSLSCGGGCKNIEYCDNCRGCSDCFGCVGLDKKQYCIFNKQYTKAEYQELVGKIKKHMDDMPYVDKAGRKYGFGEFFPPELSVFAYNESLAYEEAPLSKEQILSLGYSWREPENKNYVPTIQSLELPENIHDVNESACNEIIGCPNKGDSKTQCTFAYRILSEELKFYKKMKLPLPRYCPNCRYYDRLQWKNKFEFYNRSCMCNKGNHGHNDACPNTFETMYSPEKPETIYCKDCYQKEVY